MIGATSLHFSAIELRCKGKTCGPYKNGCMENRSKPALLAALEALRLDVNNGDPNGIRRVIIIDATRCEIHNAEAGGVGKSEHMAGEAADIRIQGMTPAEMEAVALRHTDIIRGIGRNDKGNSLHIDVRVSNTLAKWCYDKNGKWCTYFAPPAPETPVVA